MMFFCVFSKKLADKNTILFISFFLRKIGIKSGKFHIFTENRVVFCIIFKCQRDVCVVHCSLNLFSCKDSLLHKASHNFFVVGIVHIPPLFVFVFDVFCFKNVLSLLRLFWINVMTIKSNNHFNSIFFRQGKNSARDLLLPVCIVRLNF